MIYLLSGLKIVFPAGTSAIKICTFAAKVLVLAVKGIFRVLKAISGVMKQKEDRRIGSPPWLTGCPP
jgi:hypothetical protein